MRRMKRQILTAFVATCAISGASLAFADNLEEGRWAVMAFGGMYLPNPGGIDDEAIYGIRGGYALTDRWLISGSLGHSDIGPGQQTQFDANVGYTFRPEKRLSLVVTGGMGAAFYKDLAVDDSFTMNIGIGPAIGINDRLMIRILNRYRWHEDRNDDNIDQEITLGLVVKLGQ